MTYYFLESSALAKLFIYERGSDSLVRLLEQVMDMNRIVSSLALLEVRSAIRRREREADLSPVDADACLMDLASEGSRMVEQPLSPAVIATAGDILDRHPLRCLDALHLATCLMARETLGISDIYFVSSDKALLAAARQERLQIFDPLGE